MDTLTPPPTKGGLLNQCDPRLITVEDSCGCTVTRASIQALKPSDIEGDFWKEKGMDRIVANTKEARMTGVPESALTDLLLSSMAPINRITLSDSPQGSVIAPYILKPQRHRVNANYWKLIEGQAAPGAGTGVPQSAWLLTIGNHDDGETTRKYNWASPLVDIEKYFLPGRYVSIIWTTGTAKTDQKVHRGVFKILSSSRATVNVDGTGGNTPEERAHVVVEPNVSAATWKKWQDSVTAGDGDAAANAKNIAGYNPGVGKTTGMVQMLSNSVSDYENWCDQDPAENTWKLKAFWCQTIRRTHCYNEEYVKALMATHTTASFKKFRQLPLAEQRKRQMALAERAWWNTCFFGQEIDDNQQVETYDQLPKVVDPADTNCLIEYKANTVGWLKQLEQCGRVTGLMGKPLDLDQIKEMLYRLKRHREAGGGAEVTRIDAFTDRWTAGNILVVMIDYYKKKYGANTERFYKPGEALKFQGQVLWNYNVYEFPEEGVELAVIHDRFFDDLVSASPQAQKTAGRYLWLLDWSDLWLGVGGARSVARKTNEADNMYNCVIQPVVTHYQLYSETICAGMDDPNRSAIITDFSDECPAISVQGCSATSI